MTTNTASPGILHPLPRLVRFEWRCRDCGHLAYGDAEQPRCPNCRDGVLLPTLDEPGAPAPRAASA